MSADEWKQLEQLQRKAASCLSPSTEHDEFQLVAASDHGAMTDGSKRRGDEENPMGGIKSQRGISTTGMIVAGESHFVPLSSCGVTSAGYVGPSTAPPPMPSEGKYAFDLPPGVPTVERWGDTIIEFGRFEGQNVTYQEVFDNPDPAFQEYVHWASSRTKESHGLLSDFARFIQVMRKLHPTTAVKQGPVIPGTQRVRRFR